MAFVSSSLPVACGSNFDRSDEPARVILVNPAGGFRIGLFQSLDQVGERKALQFGAERIVRRDIDQFITFHNRADVETSSPHQEG